MNIKDWYGPSYEKFFMYCSTNNLLEMDELDNINLLDLNKIRGFGPKYISKIVYGYSEYNKKEGKIVPQKYEDFLSLNPCANIKFAEIVASQDLPQALSDTEYWGYDSSVILSESLLKTKIEQIVDHMQFEKFIQHCNENNIINLRDLINKRLDSYEKLQFVGKSKSNKVKSAIANYITIHSANMIPMVDANGFLYSDFLDTLGKMMPFSIMNITELTQDTIASLVMNEIKRFKDIDILVSRQDSTLDEVGKNIGLTRERVRQREEKAAKGVTPFAEFLAGEIKKHFCNTTNNVLLFSDIERFFGNKADSNIFIGALAYSDKYGKNVVKYAVFNEIECIVIGPDSATSIKTRLLEECKQYFSTPKEVADTTEFDEYLANLGFDYIDSTMLINNFLLKEGFNKLGNFLSYKTISAYDYAIRTIEEFYPNGIQLENPDVLNELRKKLKETRNITLPDNDRNVYSALQRRLHLCGKGTYCVKLPAMEASLIEKIITYIDSSKENAIPYVKIYQKFKKDLKACGYTNEYMLHGYLNELYSDAYSSRNYLKKAQYAKYDIKESSYMVVASSNKPVSIDYIQKEIGNFNETVIFNALSLDERVVLCGSSTFALAKNYELAFSDYILAKSIITDCLKERGGYCKDEMLFQHFKSKSKILNKYKINNPTLLYSVINTEFRKDYLFQRPLLYDKNVYTTTFDTYFDLLRAILENGGYIKFSEYLKALKSDCISSPAFWIGKFRMFYTPIDEDLYMNPAFFIAEKYIDATSVLKDFTAQSEYTLISKTFDFSKYGKGKVNWNYYLLYSFAKIYGKRYGYSVIEPEYYTRSAGSINKALIVRGGLENISYNDLAYKLILEDGEKTYTAYELQRYLELKEFLQGKVPMSLTSHEKISCKDGIFTVNC